MPKRNVGSVRIILQVCLVIYSIAVLWYTLGNRITGYYPTEYDIFWSYKRWFGGNWSYGIPILANIAMFMPFGFLLSSLQTFRHKKQNSFPVFFLSLAFSVLIETLQLTLMRGCFEFDDIINNLCGALLGMLFYRFCRRVVPDSLHCTMIRIASTGIVLFCVALFFLSDSTETGALMPLSQGMCFEIEDASVQNGTFLLDGICFWHNPRPSAYKIVLRSTRTGSCHVLETTRHLPRQDVDDYFNQKNLKSGFTATGQGIPENEEYEILLDFGLFRTLSTNIYLTIRNDPSSVASQSTTDIHYVPVSEFVPLKTEGTDLEMIVTDGILRVYNPDAHVYVYWYDGMLYYIAEDGFDFEDDHTTHLELLIWSNDTKNLSEKSRAAQRTWDTFSLYFEKKELSGHFGPYRVCAAELPVSYPITSIKTGYYAGRWIWQNTFWPVYDFGPSAFH